MLKEIIALRHELHRYPELSNKEFNTSERITAFINTFSPDEIIPLCATGKAFVFKGAEEGKTIMFRAELDALPITENPGPAYRSANTNISHACGHDGHMAILAGLAQKIAADRPLKGKVILLFQPAEEVEQGARDVVEDAAFKHIEPDYIFGLHNIPGVQSQKILLRSGTFAAASKGMTLTLTGKTSHAAEPENGISPANAISQIITRLQGLSQEKQRFTSLTLLTIIHIRMGEISFGTTPGYAEIMITLRAFENPDMEVLCREAEQIIKSVAAAERLTHDISYSEVFPALVNDEALVQMAAQAADENNFAAEYMQAPFKWSEDFSYYTQKYKGCFFGLGAGLTHPQLHHPDFDFPDDILETGINMFYTLYKNINL